jgi:methyl-accepting chemotaxis protein
MKNTVVSMKRIDGDKNVLNEFISNIAAISAQNSATTEEVSSAVQNQTRSIEDMFNQIKMLSATSDTLKQLLAKFSY